MPRYTHDCDSCKFLGEHKQFDLYFCARCDGGSVIARYGDNGPDYASAPKDLLTDKQLGYPAGEAMMRALELLPCPS